jgi:hypothetical protein
MLKGLFIAILVSFYGNAQNFVTIRDKNFGAFLSEKYPRCMKGNQLDVNCLEIRNEESLVINSLQIENLEGIEYFSNLKVLECLENNISSIKQLPSTLVKLDCSMNQLSYLPTLPPSLEELSCALNKLAFLPKLPESLKILYCNFNEITRLPLLPSSLEFLACGSNQISCLPILPASIFMGDIALNPLNCLSSYEVWMDEESLKLPLCTRNDDFEFSNQCICISTTLVSNSEINSTIVSTNDIQIYPNPTEGMINVHAGQQMNALRVLDFKGSMIVDNTKINRENQDKSHMQIDLSELVSGVYFVEVTLGEIISTYKVIKTN